ncbi:glycosyltransferase family 2 protein [Microbacterium sp. NPDC056569]|uniref:glycosyltransferase family 2 protein n=1 Tax=Microbacterium sp. NPDC056569 TaxID=3345867 RepID=UPI0036728A76
MHEGADRPTVAVVVRTKDRPRMLRRALASITAQTFPSWEAVIVNDGGDPATVDEVVSELPAEHRDRISVLHNPSATGRWPAANAGMQATSAPYLVLHDDDDSWHPDFLARTVAYLEANPDEVGVIARTEVILEQFDDSGEIVETGRYVLEDHNPEVLATDLLQFNRFVPIGFLYRRSLHDRIGLYDASLPAAADWAFNMRAMLIHQIRYVDDQVLAYWHQRPGVNGVAGNSVFAAPEDHDFANRAHRDRALREFMAAHGTGLPLYLDAVFEAQRNAAEQSEQRVIAAVRESNARFDELKSALDALQRHLDRTVDARVRGWVWRRKSQLRGLGRGRS